MRKESEISGKYLPQYNFVGYKFLKLEDFLKSYTEKWKKITHIGHG
jgi:hypothetical protein